MKIKSIFLSLTLSVLFVACNNQTQEADTATEDVTTQVEETVEPEITGDVYFANVNDSQEIKLPFIVEFGVNGMEVEPAGDIHAGKGHHHMIIDGTFVPKGTMVPMSATSLHYGKGQTQDTIKSLAPGTHTLTLQFADGAHMSYGEKMSKTITVRVK